MCTRQQIIDEAKTWLKTPYRHQGRLKGIASDCIGVMVQVPLALGLYQDDPEFNVTTYPLSPDPTQMRRFLDNHLDRVPPGKERGGDVLWLRPYEKAQHVALYTFEKTMIHAMDTKRGVREHRVDARWRRAIVGAWSYRGVED